MSAPRKQRPAQAPSIAPNLKTVTIDRDAQAFVRWITVRGRPLLYADLMDPSDSDFLCPVCDRPMRLATVLRPAPREKTLIFQCRPCGLSTTKTVEAKGPAIASAERCGSGRNQGHL
jgi:hypothetical protein